MGSPVETRSQSIWLDSDGILRTKVKPHLELTIEDARETVVVMGGLCAGKPRPALVDMTECMAMARDARLYLAGEQAATVAVAAALLIGSPLTRAIGNIFMGLNKPVYPTRLFTAEAEALAWLKGFLQ